MDNKDREFKRAYYIGDTLIGRIIRKFTDRKRIGFEFTFYPVPTAILLLLLWTVARYQHII